MNIHDGYTLTRIAGQPYLLPYGQAIATFSRGLQLNETGVLLWEAITAGKETDELIDLLAAQFDASCTPRETLRADVEQFLQQLHACGILEPLSPVLCFPTEERHLFSIAGILLQLYVPSALIADEFLPFTAAAGNRRTPDLTVSVRFGAPARYPVGRLLIQTAELLIMESSDGYCLRFPSSPDLIACMIDKPAHTPSSACFYCKDASSGTLREELFHGLRFAFLLHAQQHGLFAVHSASILYREKAFLFSAPSGTGKSTHAGLWHETLHTPLLNGDLNLLGMEGDTPFVYGLPWCGTSGIFTEKAYPLGGVIFLQQDTHDHAEALSADRRQLMLCHRMISPTWTRGQLLACLAFCAQVEPQIISFLLHCTPTKEAVTVCRDAIDTCENEP